MEPSLDSRLKKLKDNTHCTKNFRCFESGFKEICNAEDIILSAFVACKDLNPAFCKFSLFLGTSYYCNCPVRIFLAKEYDI